MSSRGEPRQSREAAPYGRHGGSSRRHSASPSRAHTRHPRDRDRERGGSKRRSVSDSGSDTPVQERQTRDHRQTDKAHRHRSSSGRRRQLDGDTHGRHPSGGRRHHHRHNDGARKEQTRDETQSEFDRSFDEASSNTSFSFRQRVERLDWMKIAAVDVGSVVKERDFKTLEKNLINLTYCNAELELSLDRNYLKVIQLLQLMLECLLYTQRDLRDELKARKIKQRDAMKKAAASQDQVKVLEKKRASYKQELRSRKENIVMLHSLLTKDNDFQQCPYCPKKFINAPLLYSHIERRHPHCAASIPKHDLQLPPQQQEHQHQQFTSTPPQTTLEKSDLESSRQIATLQEMVQSLNAQLQENQEKVNQTIEERESALNERYQKSLQEAAAREEKRHQADLESVVQPLQSQLQQLMKAQQEAKSAPLNRTSNLGDIEDADSDFDGSRHNRRRKGRDDELQRLEEETNKQQQEILDLKSAMRDQTRRIEDVQSRSVAELTDRLNQVEERHRAELHQARDQTHAVQTQASHRQHQDTSKKAGDNARRQQEEQERRRRIMEQQQQQQLEEEEEELRQQEEQQRQQQQQERKRRQEEQQKQQAAAALKAKEATATQRERDQAELRQKAPADPQKTSTPGAGTHSQPRFGRAQSGSSASESDSDPAPAPVRSTPQQQPPLSTGKPKEGRQATDQLPPTPTKQVDTTPLRSASYGLPGNANIQTRFNHSRNVTEQTRREVKDTVDSLLKSYGLGQDVCKLKAPDFEERMESTRGARTVRNVRHPALEGIRQQIRTQLEDITNKGYADWREEQRAKNSLPVTVQRPPTSPGKHDRARTPARSARSKPPALRPKALAVVAAAGASPARAKGATPRAGHPPTAPSASSKKERRQPPTGTPAPVTTPGTPVKQRTGNGSRGTGAAPAPATASAAPQHQSVSNNGTSGVASRPGTNRAGQAAGELQTRSQPEAAARSRPNTTTMAPDTASDSDESSPLSSPQATRATAGKQAFVSAGAHSHAGNRETGRQPAAPRTAGQHSTLAQPVTQPQAQILTPSLQPSAGTRATPGQPAAVPALGPKQTAVVEGDDDSYDDDEEEEEESEWSELNELLHQSMESPLSSDARELPVHRSAGPGDGRVAGKQTKPPPRQLQPQSQPQARLSSSIVDDESMPAPGTGKVRDLAASLSASMGSSKRKPPAGSVDVTPVQRAATSPTELRRVTGSGGGDIDEDTFSLTSCEDESGPAAVPRPRLGSGSKPLASTAKTGAPPPPSLRDATGSGFGSVGAGSSMAVSSINADDLTGLSDDESW